MTRDLINVYAYLRVSSDGQALYGNGLNWQKWAIEDYADRNGYYIENFYRDEWVSWSLASRKGLDAMIKDLKKTNKNGKNPKIKHVLVDDIDRIARDSLIWLTKKAEIESTWATIISLKQQLEDTPESRLSSNIAMATKQYERENNWRRVRSRQEQRMKDWYLCFHLPIGYKYVKAPTWWWKIAVADEPTFSIISQWLKLLANGTLPTQAALIKFLNERWAKTHSWWPINDKFMSRLINKSPQLPIYAWFVNRPERWINMVKGKHPAAITEEEFYKIATKFQMRGFYKDYSPSEIADTLPLRHILQCWCCKKPLSWSATHWHWWQYFYYYCINKKCPSYRKGCMSSKMHSEIEKFLWMLTLDEDYMDGFKEIVDTIRKEKWAITKSQIASLEKRMGEIECEIDRTVTQLTGTSSEILYKVLEEKIIKLDEEKNQVKEKILSYKSWTMDGYMEDFDWLQAIIQCPLSIRKDADMELKRLLIANIFNWELSYSRDEGVQTSEMPVVYAQKSNLRDKINSLKKMGVQTQEKSVPSHKKKARVYILG